MRDWRVMSLGFITVLSFSACGGGSGGGSNNTTPSTPDTTAPTILFTSLRLSGNVDTSAVVVADPRSDEDSSPSAYRFTATLGSDGEPNDPLGGGPPAVIVFSVVATTAVGNDEREVVVIIDP